MNHQHNDIHQHLVEACKAGNRKAYNELYNSFSKAMYNICVRMMNDAEEAKDMLQEGFVEAFRRLDSFRGESTFGAWLKRIMVNRCINELDKRRIVWVSDEMPEMLGIADEKDGPDEEELRLSVERVKKAMELLPEGARVIFSLYLIEGYESCHSFSSEASYTSNAGIRKIISVSSENSKPVLFLHSISVFPPENHSQNHNWQGIEGFRCIFSSIPERPAAGSF